MSDVVTINGKRYRRVAFHYLVPRQTFAAAGQLQPQLTIAGDYDFEMHKVMVQRTQAAVRVEMLDAAAGGAGFQNAPVPIDLWGGTGQLPFTVVPQVWKKRQQFIFNIFNDFAGANVIDIDFFGYKLVPVDASAV